jgi:RHS repeat-associated protein
MKREYSYDNADRLTQVTNTTSAGATPQTQEFLYGYDANSNRESETRKVNGQTTRGITYGYDLLDRLTAATYTATGQRSATPAAGQSASYAESLRSTSFDYDAVGNRTTASAQDHTTTITLATDNNGATTETRQSVDGALLSTTSQFDQLNRLTQMTTTGDAAGPVTYAYDNNGNLTSTTQNSQVTAGYEYDCRDQLRRVLGGGNQEVANYDYDFERHRIAKTVGSSSLKYVYSGDQITNEYDASNQLQNRYDLGAGEVVRAELGVEGTRHYFSDGQGSITGLAQQSTTTSSSLTASYEYDAWGNYLSAGGGSYNLIGYTGQRVDSETGLMPLGNGERYYSPGSGRFIQQDSMTGRLDIPPSLNRYAYAHDSPVNHTDPTGHIVPLLVLAAFLAVVAVDVAVQDYQIRSGTRAQTDFSMSEAGTMAAMQMPVLGNGIRALAGVDPLTGEHLGKGQRVFEGAMSVLDLWFVASAARGAIRGARAGSEAAGVLSEGRALARTGRGALSSAATEAEAGRSALSVVEETSQLRAGVSKAERAVDEAVESASTSGRRVDDFMQAGRERVNETRARYGFDEVGDKGLRVGDNARKGGAKLREVEISSPEFSTLDERLEYGERFSRPQEFVDDFVRDLKGNTRLSEQPTYDPRLSASGSAVISEGEQAIKVGRSGLIRDSELFKTVFHEEGHLRQIIKARRGNIRALDLVTHPDSALEEVYVESMALRYLRLYERTFGRFRH